MNSCHFRVNNAMNVRVTGTETMWTDSNDGENIWNFVK